MAKQKYSKFSLFMRSLLFAIYSPLSIFFYSFICLFSWPLPLQKRHALIRIWLRNYIYMLEKICHINYSIEGLENLKHIKNGVVLSKHQSAWETIFLPLIFKDPAVIVKRELLWVPFFGWGIAISDAISINRSKTKSAMQQIIEKGKRCLDQGRWVLIFPEGTRVPYGKVGHYRLGGARLAVATGYPVVPVAVDAGRYWPKRTFIKTPGTVQVVIGAPIETKNRSAEEVMELTKTWIESTMVRIERFVDKPAGQ